MSLIVYYDSEYDCFILQLGECFDFFVYCDFYDVCLGVDVCVCSYIVDFSEVVSMDSFVLGMLLFLCEYVGVDYVDICIVNVGSELCSIFKVVGFDKLFVLY